MVVHIVVEIDKGVQLGVVGMWYILLACLIDRAVGL